MVATWSPATSSGYYTQQCDYYSNHGGQLGVWHSTSGQFDIIDSSLVDSAHFEQLFAGISTSGKSLLPASNRRIDRTPAFDYTFSAPRSVSLLWAGASPQTRKAIELAQTRASRAALTVLEREASFARRGRGGVLFERVALSAACYQHNDSRPAEHSDGRVFRDPNLHNHCVILNLAKRADGSVGALHSTVLRDWKMAVGATYHSALAHELQTLGFAIDRLDYNGTFEVAGIDDAAIQYFSARHNEIEDELAHACTTSKEAPALAAAIAKSTRSAKRNQSTADQTREWNEAALANGLRFDQIEQRTREAAAHINIDKIANAQLPENYVATLIAEVMATQSVVDRRDLVRAATAGLVGSGLSPEHITEKLDQLIRDEVFVVLGSDSIGQARYSTPQRIQLEREVVAIAARLVNSRWHEVQPMAMKCRCVALGLSAEQTSAAIAACSKQRIAVIEGSPGSGKTTTLTPIVSAYCEAGFRVIGASSAWRIANMLHDDLQIESRAISSWLERSRHGQPFLDHRTLLIVDEAGLLSSEDTHTLLKAVEQSGAKLLLVGDREQLQAIGGAAGLPLVARAVEHSRVSTIIRQHDAWARDAVIAFGQGKASQALAAFVQRNQFIEAAGERATVRAIGDQWAELREQQPAATTLLIAKTNAEVTAISREIRTRLIAEGLVYGPDISVRVVTPSGHTSKIQIAAGDRIRFLVRNDALGVINGTSGTVVRVSGPESTSNLYDQIIEAEVEGKRITFSPADLVDEKGRARLAWAYAATAFGSQGLTVDNAIVLLSQSFDRHDSYVAASRARNTTVLVTDKDAIDRSIRLTRTPDQNRIEPCIPEAERHDWLAGRLSRSSVKESTLDLIELDQISQTAKLNRAHEHGLESEALEL